MLRSRVSRPIQSARLCPRISSCRRELRTGRSRHEPRRSKAHKWKTIGRAKARVQKTVLVAKRRLLRFSLAELAFVSFAFRLFVGVLRVVAVRRFVRLVYNQHSNCSKDQNLTNECAAHTVANARRCWRTLSAKCCVRAAPARGAKRERSQRHRRDATNPC